MAMVNGFYDVPQTDDPLDAAMASMIARLRASQPKPETIPAATPTIASVDVSLALMLAEAIGDGSSALCDRATGPILKWDATLDGKARAIAHLKWMLMRGAKRGDDGLAPIEASADRAQEYLARLRPGGDMNGKTEHPRYVDSGGNVPQDAGIVRSAATSDAWARRPGS